MNIHKWKEFHTCQSLCTNKFTNTLRDPSAKTTRKSENSVSSYWEKTTWKAFFPIDTLLQILIWKTWKFKSMSLGGPVNGTPVP